MGEKFGDFDKYSWSWSEYCEWLETYFKENNTAEELKVTYLISAVGSATEGLIVKLCSPSKPADEDYKNIIQIVRDHFQSKPFIKEERQKFRQTKQEEKTITEFADILRKIARLCDFGERQDEHLQEQFSSGLRSESIRIQLNYGEETLTFSKLISMSRDLETAEKKAAENNYAKNKNSEKETISKQSGSKKRTSESNAVKNTSLKENAINKESAEKIAVKKTSSKQSAINKEVAVNNAEKNTSSKENALIKEAGESNAVKKTSAKESALKKAARGSNAVKKTSSKESAIKKVAEEKKGLFISENIKMENKTAEIDASGKNAAPEKNVTEKSVADKNATANNVVENKAAKINAAIMVAENEVAENNALEKNEAENNEAKNNAKEENPTDVDCADKRTVASREETDRSSYQRSGDQDPRRGLDRRGATDGGERNWTNKRDFKETGRQRSNTQEREQCNEIGDGEIHSNMDNPQYSLKRLRREDWDQWEKQRNGAAQPTLLAQFEQHIPQHLRQWYDQVKKCTSESHLEMAFGACKQKLVDFKKSGRNGFDVAIVHNVCALICGEKQWYDEGFRRLEWAENILKSSYSYEGHPLIAATYRNYKVLQEKRDKSKYNRKPSTRKH